jgi:hypothetical protein
MDDVGKSPAARLAPKQDIVGARFKKHEVRIFFWRLRHELEPENLGIEGPAAGEIAHRNGHVQNAFGLDHTHLLPSRDGIAACTS